MSKERIAIFLVNELTSETGKAEIDAEVFGVLAVHQLYLPLEGASAAMNWIVTHLPTGRALLACEDYATALALADGLNPDVPQNGSWGERLVIIGLQEPVSAIMNSLRLGGVVR